MPADASAVDPQAWVTAVGTILGGAIVYCVQVLRGRKSPEPSKQIVLDSAGELDDEMARKIADMLSEGLKSWADIREDIATMRRQQNEERTLLERLDKKFSEMEEKARLEEARRQGKEDAQKEAREEAERERRDRTRG